jgi:hypothetical protein
MFRIILKLLCLFNSKSVCGTDMAQLAHTCNLSSWEAGPRGSMDCLGYMVRFCLKKKKERKEGREGGQEGGREKEKCVCFKITS